MLYISYMETRKVKSVAKQVSVNDAALTKVVLNTMEKISRIVGSTLGPHGRHVLIERYDYDMPPFVTKDGVTVFRSLGFADAREHCIMEVARDAAIRTAKEAGDGTTTATILSEAIVRRIYQFTTKYPKVSPQRIVRDIEKTFRDFIEPTVKTLSRQVTRDTDENRETLRAVATISANGDTDLADAVIRCFDICGDEGNVTIEEAAGNSGYTVQKIEGYPVMVGYDECCRQYYSRFINDGARQICAMDKPVFLLYYGDITEMQQLTFIGEQVGRAWEEQKYNHNVVVCARSFSDSVLATLAVNFAHESTINVFPLAIPRTSQTNSQMEWLYDVAAVTGAIIFDPANRPIDTAELEHLGHGIQKFESNRGRSYIFGYSDETLLEMRIDELKQALINAVSDLDALYTQERIAKLAGGIAKLKVVGSSNGETKEKRDRAEDAVCAVRGALKSGTLPGGGWTLLKLCNLLPYTTVNDEILRPAFYEPFNRLLSNGGFIDDREIQTVLRPILEGLLEGGEALVYDFLENKHVRPYEAGILDSAPAVTEAIRSSISIATLIGTMGGIVAFPRDDFYERQEASETAEYIHNVGMGAKMQREQEQ